MKLSFDSRRSSSSSSLAAGARLRIVCAAIQQLLLIGVVAVLSRSKMTFAEVPTIVEYNNVDNEPSADNHAHSYIEGCKRSGFDPLQLACTTCTILPANHQSRCNDCCQSYKTLEKQSKRYQLAILVVNPGVPEAVKELLRDDKDRILERKGPKRFMVHDKSDDEEDEMARMMGMLYGRRQEPSGILWFDKPPPRRSLSLEELSDMADDFTVLASGHRGLGRDDIRDMLLTLLPDLE
mmetsp:Transcript_18403/g.40074  ORF Transcript_18403/g.40074 Transcript_18403/m.40074 type:complete len:237 (-) Transcript_18403:366-1076(-)